MRPSLTLSIVLGIWLLASLHAQAQNLYRSDQFRPLVSDRRAHRVGDILTVLVVENASASATAGTNTDKNNDLGVRFSSPTSPQKNYALSVEQEYDGGGKSARTGKLLAQISVEVKAVEQNGDMLISGVQDIEINDEKQTINLAGKVRSIDVDERNTVLSTRVANAKITYVGNGVLAESQHKGWLSRLITLFGLF
jgi:flagellar L-ring protein precursor FlgH